MGKSKKRATKRTPKRFTPAEVQQIVAGAVARWQGMARGIPDPPGTKVIEVTFEDAPPVSETERQSGIRLHKRLVDLERVSRRIIENPETTARRQELAEQILRMVGDARTLWASGTRPDAMMGPIEQTANTLNLLTLLPLAAKASKPSSPRADAITEALRGFARTARDAGARALWPRVADQFGWQIRPERDGAEERLVDAEGHVRITYSEFKKRLTRAKKRA